MGLARHRMHLITTVRGGYQSKQKQMNCTKLKHIESDSNYYLHLNVLIDCCSIKLTSIYRF